MTDPKNEKKDVDPNIERERLQNEIHRKAQIEADRKAKESQKSNNCTV